MIRRLLTAAGLAVLAGCSGSSTPTDPPSPGPGPAPAPAPSPPPAPAPPPVPAPAPSTAAVIVGNDFFKSGHNGSTNRAVDSVAVGGTVTWTWTNTGAAQHSIRSLGLTIFRNSVVKSGDGSTYQAVFVRPGTYEYDCAIHGEAMTGTIVVR